MLLALLLHLELTPCLDVSLAEVERLVKIELEAQLIEALDPGVPRASIHCDGSRATLTYERATRTIDLARIDARARPRLLALALAELAAPRHEAAAPPLFETPAITAQTLPPPPAATATITVAALAPASARPSSPPAATSTPAFDLHLAASILGGVSFFTAGAPPLFGGRAAVELAPSAFGARLDAAAAYGSERLDLGDATLLTVSAGLSGFGRFDLTPVSLDIGAGLRAGFARIRGTPRNPSLTEGATVSGAWLGPFLATRASGRVGPVLLAVELEAGLVIRPVIGRGENALVAADGAWFGIHVGAGI